VVVLCRRKKNGRRAKYTRNGATGSHIDLTEVVGEESRCSISRQVKKSTGNESFPKTKESSTVQGETQGRKVVIISVASRKSKRIRPSEDRRERMARGALGGGREGQGDVQKRRGR